MAKVSIRSCVGCRKASEKTTFLRVVKANDGFVTIDTTGRVSGRGAYLCHNEVCLKKALKGSRLARALRATVDEDLITKLMITVSSKELG